MKKIALITLLLFTSISSLSCASGHQETRSENQHQVRNIAIIEERLRQAAEKNEVLSADLIGNVTYDGESFPIWAALYDSDNNPDKINVLICAGIHGNEPASVETALTFIDKLTTEPELYKSLRVHILPVVNPWGWSYDVRFNREGLDVNRDFASFASQEAKIVKSFIADRHYNLIIDCHEDPSASGFYLYQYGNQNTDISREIIEEIKELGFPIEQEVNMVILKTDDGLIDAPLWGLWYMKLTKQLSMANYLRLNNSKNVYTVETPTYPDQDERVAIQNMVIDKLINSLQP
jgi:hypothetical protein